MKKIIAVLCIFAVVACTLSACEKEDIEKTDEETEASVNTEVNEETEYYKEDEDRYIIQTPWYQIYEIGLQQYKYRIEFGGTVFVDDIKTGSSPRIEDIGDGIVKLHLGYGTNAFTVKYFNVYDNEVSQEFYPFTNYAEYVNTVTNEYYFAYFKMEQEPKLYIDGFFDSSDHSYVLDLNFMSPICEKLIFLNESEIYIEYTDENSENIRKVVNFKDAGGGE